MRIVGGSALLAGLACVASAACAGAETAVPPTPAEQVAALLVVAEEQSGVTTRRGRAALRQTVERLERLGAHSAGGGDDPLPGWRTAAGGRSGVLRGRVLGPAFRNATLAPQAEFRVQQLFLGGQAATVAIAAAPAAALRVSVTGPDHAEACAASPSACRWTPSYTQRYTISVRNTGARPARMYLVVN